MEIKVEHDCPTIATRNSGESTDMEIFTLNKLTTKRKVKCIENPHNA